jgi:AcrR family transcriptional regulator
MKAARRVLGERPEASLEEIAKAAGVARQTIYAHDLSREALIRAVQRRALDQIIAILDAAHLDQGPPEQALERLLDACWAAANENQIFDIPAVPTNAEEEYERHLPLLRRLDKLVERGQRVGVFDRRLPAHWLEAAFIGLAHAAGAEVITERMDSTAALDALERSTWRIYGIDR